MTERVSRKSEVENPISVEEPLDAVVTERLRIASLLRGNLVPQLDLLLAQIKAYQQVFRATPQTQMALAVLASLSKQALQQAHDLEVEILSRNKLQYSSGLSLSGREVEVIGLVAQGLTNKEIALRLDISPRTVKYHLDKIFSKLGVNTRAEAAVCAFQRGLVNTITN
jgi:DNA-binding NarL/FixJ family response regulator